MERRRADRRALERRRLSKLELVLGLWFRSPRITLVPAALCLVGPALPALWGWGGLTGAGATLLVAIGAITALGYVLPWLQSYPPGWSYKNYYVLDQHELKTDHCWVMDEPSYYYEFTNERGRRGFIKGGLPCF